MDFMQYKKGGVFSFYAIDSWSAVLALFTPTYLPAAGLTLSSVSSATSANVRDSVLHHSPIYANSGTAVAAAAASSSSAHLAHQVESLRVENAELKANINEMVKKIGKVNTLEQEMAKIHQAYQALLKHSEKREGLEKSARAKLQSVIINLSEANKEVTERHEAVMAQLMSGEPKNQNIPGLDAILRY